MAGGGGVVIPGIDCERLDIFDVNVDFHIQSNTYDFVQCLHVLEHVGNPLSTLSRCINYARIGAIIYIEVPMELPPINEISENRFQITFHEHFNYFCVNSICALANSTNKLMTLECTLDHISLLTSADPHPIIRYLGLVVPNSAAYQS